MGEMVQFDFSWNPGCLIGILISGLYWCTIIPIWLGRILVGKKNQRLTLRFPLSGSIGAELWNLRCVAHIHPGQSKYTTLQMVFKKMFKIAFQQNWLLNRDPYTYYNMFVVIPLYNWLSIINHTDILKFIWYFFRILYMYPKLKPSFFHIS